MNITEFLEARIAEDEAVAQRVSESGGEPGGQGLWSVQIGVSGNDAKFAHVAADPARVLAECAAKRAALESYLHLRDSNPVSDPIKLGRLTAFGDIVQDLAEVYKDHPDYQEDWAV